MPYYEYRGTHHDEDVAEQEREHAAARARLAAATKEAYPRNDGGHTIVLTTPHGTGMDEETARRVALIVRAMPLAKTRQELLTLSGYRDDGLRAIMRRHKLTKLYNQYNRLPMYEGQDIVMVTKDGHRIKQSTIVRFNLVRELILTTDLTRAEIVKRAGYRDESTFHRAVQRHGQTALWDALPKGGTTPPPAPAPRHAPERIENLEHLLTDTSCSKEEALRRVGWNSFETFSRAAYRVGRPDMIRAYHSHGA